MTQIGEAVAVDATAPNTGDCWYCKEKPPEEVQNKMDESPSGDAENGLRNCAATLGVNLGKRPKWKIAVPHDKSKRTPVVPAAHHLIPGNASLKKATALLKFMCKGQVVESDIGYDVNGKGNGVWLPGNYGVNPLATHFKMKWTAYNKQDDYAILAMDQANAQFHDAHPEYSSNVLATLRSIANKLAKEPKDKCPVCDKKKEKKRPPYGLVGRLNFVSGQHEQMLLSPRTKKKYVTAGYFTSSRVHRLFGP
ncbi:MAG TPA: AHH domain-containing protein [Gemmatimonadaceae bacterium]|nr:AHH domain-containing protein [Gemmatimonadaceae bacterium]